jgi:hypothetical protein
LSTEVIVLNPYVDDVSEDRVKGPEFKFVNGGLSVNLGDIVAVSEVSRGRLENVLFPGWRDALMRREDSVYIPARLGVSSSGKDYEQLEFDF